MNLGNTPSEIKTNYHLICHYAASKSLYWLFPYLIIILAAYIIHLFNIVIHYSGLVDLLHLLLITIYICITAPIIAILLHPVASKYTFVYTWGTVYLTPDSPSFPIPVLPTRPTSSVSQIIHFYLCSFTTGWFKGLYYYIKYKKLTAYL